MSVPTFLPNSIRIKASMSIIPFQEIISHLILNMEIDHLFMTLFPDKTISLEHPKDLSKDIYPLEDNLIIPHKKLIKCQAINNLIQINTLPKVLSINNLFPTLTFTKKISHKITYLYTHLHTQTTNFRWEINKEKTSRISL